MLQHEFGVAPKDMEFWMERRPEVSHGGATGFVPPPGVTLHYIPPEKNIGSMMLSGEFDATLLYLANPNLVDRSTADLWHHPDIAPLFPDTVAEGVRFYRKTGLFPINHGMVVKREIAEKHPWTVLNLLKAFEQANEIANRERVEQASITSTLACCRARPKWRWRRRSCGMGSRPTARCWRPWRNIRTSRA